MGGKRAAGAERAVAEAVFVVDMDEALAAEAGATEALKARDPMKWVGLMNTCKAQAEEVILAELIYA